MLAVAAAIASAAAVLFARITGWSDLARAFPAPAGATDARSRTGGVVVGAWGWNAPPLRAGVDDDGLTLDPRPPFRAFFRPVRIPWNAVTGFERREYMFFEVFRLRCGEETALGFLPSEVTDAIERRLSERPAAELSPQEKTPSP
jgi:hypothetical protein